MSHLFRWETAIQPEWIDYNNHMRDAFYGLVYSLAVDGVQDEVGFDAAYREATGCTIYLLEGHTVFLREVKLGEVVRVETRLIGLDRKRFHLHMQMWRGDVLASVGEFMELHVDQHPEPHAAEMPEEIHAVMARALVSEEEAAALPHRSRAMGLRR